MGNNRTEYERKLKEKLARRQKRIQQGMNMYQIQICLQFYFADNMGEFLKITEVLFICTNTHRDSLTRNSIQVWIPMIRRMKKMQKTLKRKDRY